jgi:drug/metabolite transporter (DMT)-like permease
VQLSVPVIAVVGGVLFLDEAINLRVGLASLTILGGIALMVLQRAEAA